MKKCPFCAEEIQDEAVKCRFCGEWLSETSCHDKLKVKWYYTNSAVIIALICFGPIALPLVWLNPYYKLTTKLVVTIIVVVLTILFSYLFGHVYHEFMKQLEILGVN